MKLTISRGWMASILVLLIVLADQGLKVWIKTHLALHEGIRFTDWFYLYFTENNGMAYGIELFDKLFLTLFRLGAAGWLIWYLSRIVPKSTVRFGYIVCVCLILAGALGNIFDCLFYGIIFDDSVGHLATLFPQGGGYGTFFYGKVVDMLYFPLIDAHYPNWIPFVGGDSFLFFRPIFNVADSAITVGIFMILLFFRRDIVEVTTVKEEKEEVEISTEK